MDVLSTIISGLWKFEFYYPLFMAYLWMTGGLYYYYHREVGRTHHIEDTPVLREYPPVSIIVPCYNEGRNIEETIQYLAGQQYPDFEIIAVNDGSTDETGSIIDKLSAQFPGLRVVHLATNQGKAMALRMGAMLSRHEFLVCIDGDAVLDPRATTWMMSNFVDASRVGAVTGNPRVRTRSTLLGKVQVGEFSSIIGLIKRAQRIYGRMFTVSGVVAAYRKSALQEVGLWRLDMVTEDIDISWKLQLNHWDIRFEPNALCWIKMPETYRGLWRQRLRWAQGGMEALIAYLPNFWSWRKRRMWGIYLEYITSVFWAYMMAVIMVLWLIGLVIKLPQAFQFPTVIPNWNGILLGVTCLIQFLVSMLIDSRYERDFGKYYYWIIWYPVVYWILNVFTTVVAVPRAIFGRRGKRARWVSPDRGLQAP